LPLSIHPDSEFFVATGNTPFDKLRGLIELSDGGVIGVTGVRGAGKSVLLNRILDVFKGSSHTLHLSAPISSSREMEFFLTLFRLLCQSVLERVRRADRNNKDDLVWYSQHLIVRWRAILTIFAVACAVLLMTQERAVNAVIQNVRQDQPKLIAYIRSLEGSTAESERKLLESVALRLGLNPDTSLTYDLSSYTIPYTSTWIWLRQDLSAEERAVARRAGLSYTMSWYTDPRAIRAFYLWLNWIPYCAGFGACAIAYFFWRRLRFVQRHSDTLALMKRTEELIERLDHEIISTRDSEYPVLSVLGSLGRRRSGRHLKTRSLSLPGLTSEYIEYVKAVLRVFPGKLIVCIDELDKVSDTDHVRFILREIKGALYVKGCFYVLSISEDAVRSFETRLAGQRDIFESTFDEVLIVSLLDLKACHTVIARRLNLTDTPTAQLHHTLTIAATLSGGNARDLIRNTREIVQAANGQGGIVSVAPESAWRVLFDRKYKDAIERLITTPSTSLDDVRATVFSNVGSLVQDRSPVNDWHDRLSIATKAIEGRLHSTSSSDSADVHILHSWLRLLVELEIFLRLLQEVRLAETTNEIFDLRAEQLRAAYGLLPYSVLACRAKLQSFAASQQVQSQTA
jgi:hypothetical protein